MKLRHLFLFFFFWFVIPAESQSEIPFVWSVERVGRTSYFLGTVHAGVSLDEIPCSDAILEKIQNSDLLLLEASPKNDFEELSKEEQSKVFIGTREEMAEVMSKLSPESQEIIKERKKVAYNTLKDGFPYQVQSTESGGFEDLSPESQRF